jgi:hypothetical protein
VDHEQVVGTSAMRRVGMWRDGCRLNISVAASFVWRCLIGSAITPFPHPAHRTARHDRGKPHKPNGKETQAPRFRLVPFREIKINTAPAYLVKGSSLAAASSSRGGHRNAARAFGRSTSPCTNRVGAAVAQRVVDVGLFHARPSIKISKPRATSFQLSCGRTPARPQGGFCVSRLRESPRPAPCRRICQLAVI